MLDFIGKEIKVGDWIAGGGSGNSSAEYGMILYLVREVTEDRLKLTRLKVTYPQHTRESAEVHVRKMSATNSNRYVVVKPAAKVKALFKRALNDNLRPGDAQFIGTWIHGSGNNGQVFA